jgi:LCP family protein required for cell wall assembly
VIAIVALGGPRALLDALVRPEVLLALLLVNLVLALYHLLAIDDAFRAGRRRVPGPLRLSARRSPLLLGALAATVAIHAGIELVGFQAYQAEAAIFVGPNGGWTIPASSFAPTSTPGAATLPSATVLPTPTPVPVPAWATDGRLNLLLIGSDAGPGRWLARTDTLVVLSVDVATARAALFGIPRNMVNVPLPPESAGAFRNGRFPAMINSLYVYAMGHPDDFPGGEAAGFRAVSGAIQELLGVPLDGVVVINLNGFVDLVDAIGGVWVNSPYTVVDNHYPTPDGRRYIRIVIPAGCQLFDGERALEYARTRHMDSDYGRMQRQQRVLLALARQVDPIALLPRVGQLLDIARDNIWTTIQPNDVADLAVLAAKVDADEVSTIIFKPLEYPEYLNTAAIDHIRAVVASALDAPVASPSAKPSPTPKACPKQT